MCRNLRATVARVSTGVVGVCMEPGAYRKAGSEDWRCRRSKAGTGMPPVKQYMHTFNKGWQRVVASSIC
jgi:hypothetical protein